MNRKSQYYDDDDFDDGYSDEEDWDEDEDDYDDAPVEAPKPKKQPAAPAPAKQHTKPATAAKAQPPKSGATSQQPPQKAHNLSNKMADLHVGDAKLMDTDTKHAAPLHRPLSEYHPDSDIQQACAAAISAETSHGGKPRLHLVVLGHVDAGKSTLMGRLLYELGNIEEKTVHKTKREAAAAGKASFAWAWMLDERPEERARGVTVDIAVTRFETPKLLVTLLDAPGHREFVPNMIAGAAQADAALLVVDGSPGGFEAGFDPATGVAGGGQTREHAQLARSLGVEQVAVVITKLDTCDFSQERFLHIKSQLEPFLNTCGFKSSHIQWLPAIGPSGTNLTKPPIDEPLLTCWWNGPTLVAAIDTFQPAHRLLERPLRLPVSEAGAKTGKGGVSVAGKIEGGALKPGSKVFILPSKEIATVKLIEVHGKHVTLGMAGDSVDVTLTGIEPNTLHAGSVLCHPDFPAPLASKFEARIVVLDVAIPLLKGQQVTLHSHAARESGHISGLVSLLDSKTGDLIKQRPRCLLKGQSAIVHITPSRAMCLETYADYKSLGRVALRGGGRTIAVGIVTEIIPAE